MSGLLRQCSYCHTWKSAPCGENCVWSHKDPTLCDLQGDSRKDGAEPLPIGEDLNPQVSDIANRVMQYAADVAAEACVPLIERYSEAIRVLRDLVTALADTDEEGLIEHAEVMQAARAATAKVAEQ